VTVDDLVKVYCDAFYAQRDKAPEKGITEADRAGVTAIVRALRDETRHMTLNRDGLEELFTQILGDAGEKVATACATSQTTGVTDGNRQSERERHFPQGLQTVDSGGAETVGRCERCGGSLTRRDQSQLAFEVAILGDYETRRNRNVGGESNHGVTAVKAEGVTDSNASPSAELCEDCPRIGHSTDETRCTTCPRRKPTDAAPAVCVWTGEEYVTYSTSCESEHEVDPHKAPPTHCPSCGKPIAFTEANHG